MPLIRQEEVYPAAQYPWAQAVEMVANGAVARYDLVVVNSVAATGSVIPKAAPADASVAGSRAGVIMVATGAAANGEKFLAVPWVVITGVDTNAATAAGYPVYLSTTAGGWTVAKPSGANEAVVPVGTVLVKDATDGAVMLKPGTGALEGFTKVGTVTVASGGTTSPTVALGGNFANGRAVATINEATTNSTTVRYVTVSVAGDLVVELTADPGASNADVTYVVYSGAL